MKQLSSIFFIFLFNFSFAQKTPQINDLEKQLTNADTKDSIIILNKLAKIYISRSPEKTIEYSNDVLKKIKNEEIPEKTIHVYLNLGIAYFMLNDYEAAYKYTHKAHIDCIILDNNALNAKCLEIIGNIEIEQYKYKEGLRDLKQAILIAKNSLNHTEHISALLSLCKFYITINNYQKALQICLEALSISEQNNIIISQADAFINMGIIYENQNDFKQASHYYYKAIDINTELNNNQGLATSYNKTGILYYKLKDYPKSLQYLQKSLKLRETLGNKKNIAQTLSNIGNVYAEQATFVKAIEYYILALDIGKKIKDKIVFAKTAQKLADVYIKYKKYDEAILYLKQSQRLAESFNNNEILEKVYYSMYDLNYKLNDYKKAIKFLHLRTYTKEILDKNRNEKQIAELQWKYETKQNEKKYNLLKNEKNLQDSLIRKQYIIIGITILAFLLVLILFIVIYKSYKLNKKKKIELINNKHEILEKTEELSQQKEEIETQTEALGYSNKELKRLSIIARETSNAIMILNPNGEFEWVNNAFTTLFEFTLKQLINHRGNNIISSHTHPQIKKLITDCIEKKQTVSYEVEITSKSGKKIWMHTTLTPVLDDNKKITQIIAIDADISKLKAADAEINKQKEEIVKQLEHLEELNSEKNSIIGIVAHDLKSPLNNISNILKLIEEDNELNEKLKNKIDLIYIVVENGLRLIQDLLDVNEVEMQTDIKHEKVELATFISDEIERVKHTANKKRINIKFTNESKNSFILTDTNTLSRIFANLLTNAIKFSSFDKNIFIRVFEKEDSISFAIKDEGPGFTNEDIKKIFKKFQKLSARPTNNESSSGLGLSIVKISTERLGGIVYFTTKINKGTEFIIQLPRA